MTSQQPSNVVEIAGAGTRSLTVDQLTRIFDKVAIDDGCWIWTAYTYNGYGRLSLFDKSAYAHRVVYQILRGKIPDGLELDHLCRNRRCVNPDHLQAVTRRVNNLRGVGAGSRNFRKKTCPRGHAYDVFEVISGVPTRRCRTCHNAWMRNVYKNRARRLANQVRNSAGRP